MKKLLPVLLLFTVTTARAQNEFANAPFYDAVKNIYNDGQTGFAKYKGAKYNSIGSIISVHRSKLVMPGADSGSIYLPVAYSHPAASFSFTAGTQIKQGEQKATRLATAVRTALGKTLYEKKKVDTTGKFVFYHTYYYDKPNPATYDREVFEVYYVLERGRYLAVLKINGTTPPPPKPATVPEPELETKINRLLQSMNNFFTDELGRETEKTQYYTQYESKTALYGTLSKIKVRTYETGFSFQLSKIQAPAEARAIYEKLLDIFKRSGKFSFNAEKTEGTRTYVFASALTSKIVKPFTLVLEYYGDESYPSVGFLITRKKD